MLNISPEQRISSDSFHLQQSRSQNIFFREYNASLHWNLPFFPFIIFFFRLITFHPLTVWGILTGVAHPYIRARSRIIISLLHRFGVRPMCNIVLGAPTKWILKRNQTDAVKGKKRVGQRKRDQKKDKAWCVSSLSHLTTSTKPQYPAQSTSPKWHLQ